MSYQEPSKEVKSAIIKDEISTIDTAIYRLKIRAEAATISGSDSRAKAFERDIEVLLTEREVHENKLKALA